MKKSIAIALSALFTIGITSSTMAQNAKTEINKAGNDATKEASKEVGKTASAPTKVVIKSENAILHDTPSNSKATGKIESAPVKETDKPAPVVVHPIGKVAPSTSNEVKQTKSDANKTTLRLEQNSKDAQIEAPAATKTTEKSAEKVAEDASTKAIKVAEKETLKAVDKSVDNGRSKKDNTPK